MGAKLRGRAAGRNTPDTVVAPRQVCPASSICAKPNCAWPASNYAGAMGLSSLRLFPCRSKRSHQRNPVGANASCGSRSPQGLSALLLGFLVGSEWHDNGAHSTLHDVSP